MNHTYQQVDVIDYRKSKYANIFTIGSFVVSVLAGVVLIILSNSFSDNSVENPWFLLGCLGYIVLHEGIHFIFMKVFSREEIHVSVKFPSISVGSNAKYCKRQFMMIILAPVMILGAILALFIICAPKEYTFFFSVLLILNFAGSGGDYLQAFAIRKFSADTLFQDNSVETKVFKRNSI